nr:hypothetical protein [Anaerolineae bacterium]
MLDNLTSLIEGAINKLGLTFFLSGWVPMLIGTALNQYVLVQSGSIWNFFPELDGLWLGLFSGQLLTTILISLGLALLLLPLNTPITRLFEGLLPGMKVVLYPLLALKQRKHKRLYADIHARHLERRQLLTTYELSGEYDEEADFGIQEVLEQLHKNREKEDVIQRLPYDPGRLTPTCFGNAWAVMEEYPLLRYGMDSMIFWPYLRTILTVENPALLQQIDNQKLLVDIMIHLSFVLGIVSVESLVFAISQARWGLLILAGGLVLLFALFYRAGVNYTRAMGLSISQSFDLCRKKLLNAFDLKMPDDLDDEYWAWMRLSAFIRRGEPYYFNMLDRKEEKG